MTSGDPLEVEFLAAKRAALSAPKKGSLSDAFSADSTRSKLSVLWRLLRARIGPGKLSVGEYKIYTKLMEPGENLYAFAGVRAQERAHAVCNDRDWFSVTKNKLVFELLMRGADLPVVNTLAAYDRKGRGSGVPVLSSRDELLEFLANARNYPVFCKPTTGVNSLGTLLLDKPESGSCLVNHETTRTFNEIADFIQNTSPKGFLFQKVLRADPEFSKISGTNTLCSLRLFVLLQHGDVRIERCLVKIPGDSEVADNFWREGAQLWAVDVQTGEIIRKVRSTGKSDPEIVLKNQAEMGRQKETVPKFAEACKVVQTAARMLSGIQTQSWDVALTESGPVLLEVNFGGDLSLPQIAYGQGIFSREYCEHLRKLDYKGPLPEFK